MHATHMHKTKTDPSKAQPENSVLLDLGSASEVTKVKEPGGFESEFPQHYKGF